jgi:hypothetical protein
MTRQRASRAGRPAERTGSRRAPGGAILDGMDGDWPRKIRARNTRELVAAGVLAGVVVFTRGFTLQSAPILAALAWVAWFLVRYAGWQAAPGDAGVGVRRELIRQGHLLMSAWAWYVLPLIAGGLLSISAGTWSRGILLAAGVALAAVNYRAGKRLVDEGNR